MKSDDKIWKQLSKGKFQNAADLLNMYAKKHATAIYGEDDLIYPCGFAWILFDKESESNPFVKWMIETKYNGIYMCPDKGMYRMYINDYNQSHDHKYQHAVECQSILYYLDIIVYVESRWD